MCGIKISNFQYASSYNFERLTSFKTVANHSFRSLLPYFKTTMGNRRAGKNYWLPPLRQLKSGRREKLIADSFTPQNLITKQKRGPKKKKYTGDNNSSASINRWRPSRRNGEPAKENYANTSTILCCK